MNPLKIEGKHDIFFGCFYFSLKLAVMIYSIVLKYDVQILSMHYVELSLFVSVQSNILSSSNSDNALSGCGDIGAEPAGHHSFLSFEQSDSIIGLPILKYDQKRVTATASWDSSIHDSVYLNRVTQNTERVYVILKV